MFSYYNSALIQNQNEDIYLELFISHKQGIHWKQENYFKHSISPYLAYVEVTLIIYNRN